MQNKKVVITGGAGFIGSNLVDALVDNGFNVHVIDNFSGGKKENVNKKATLHVADIRNLDDISPIIDGAEYVFHLAALPRVQYSIENPVETNDVNIGGTLNVLIASQKGAVKRVVYSASSSAYGDQSKMPLREDMIANPKSPYGLHKYIGELYCKVWSMVHGLETVSLRYFNVYGKTQIPNAVTFQRPPEHLNEWYRAITPASPASIVFRASTHPTSITGWRYNCVEKEYHYTPTKSKCVQIDWHYQPA